MQVLQQVTMIQCSWLNTPWWYNLCRHSESWIWCSCGNHESGYNFTMVIGEDVNHCELLWTFINVRYGDSRTVAMPTTNQIRKTWSKCLNFPRQLIALPDEKSNTIYCHFGCRYCHQLPSSPSLFDRYGDQLTCVNSMLLYNANINFGFFKNDIISQCRSTYL